MSPLETWVALLLTFGVLSAAFEGVGRIVDWVLDGIFPAHGSDSEWLWNGDGDDLSIPCLHCDAPIGVECDYWCPSRQADIVRLGHLMREATEMLDLDAALDAFDLDAEWRALQDAIADERFDEEDHR